MSPCVWGFLCLVGCMCVCVGGGGKGRGVVRCDISYLRRGKGVVSLVLGVDLLSRIVHKQGERERERATE